MKTNRVLAYCPCCRQTRRFTRVKIHHGVHAAITAVTFGLWSVSWLAVTAGHWLWPWKCKTCGGNEPDFRRTRAAAADAPAPETAPESTPAVVPTPESVTAG